MIIQNLEQWTNYKRDFRSNALVKGERIATENPEQYPVLVKLGGRTVFGIEFVYVYADEAREFLEAAGYYVARDGGSDE